MEKINIESIAWNEPTMSMEKISTEKNRSKWAYNEPSKFPIKSPEKPKEYYGEPNLKKNKLSQLQFIMPAACLFFIIITSCIEPLKIELNFLNVLQY